MLDCLPWSTYIFPLTYTLNWLILGTCPKRNFQSSLLQTISKHPLLYDCPSQKWWGRKYWGWFVQFGTSFSLPKDCWAEVDAPGRLWLSIHEAVFDAVFKQEILRHCLINSPSTNQHWSRGNPNSDQSLGKKKEVWYTISASHCHYLVHLAILIEQPCHAQPWIHCSLLPF